MALFRIETVLDPSTGLYFIEAYYPNDAATPFAVTKPIYASHENAEIDAIEMFKRGIPDQPITDVYRQ